VSGRLTKKLTKADQNIEATLGEMDTVGDNFRVAVDESAVVKRGIREGEPLQPFLDAVAKLNQAKVFFTEHSELQSGDSTLRTIKVLIVRAMTDCQRHFAELVREYGVALADSDCTGAGGGAGGGGSRSTALTQEQEVESGHRQHIVLTARKVSDCMIACGHSGYLKEYAAARAEVLEEALQDHSDRQQAPGGGAAAAAGRRRASVAAGNYHKVIVAGSYHKMPDRTAQPPNRPLTRSLARPRPH
jgi:hypothetical protein